MSTTLSNRVSVMRRLAAWIVLPAFISLVAAHEVIITNYPGAVGYSSAPRPPEWLMWWRNGSLVLVLLFSLVSIPRWQSLVGLGGTLLFLYFALKF